MTSTASVGDLTGAPDYAFDWALVDVETSGLQPGQHRVLSVAVITVDAGGERSGEFSTLLDPGCDPGPVRIHGLTAARLRGAPTFDQITGRIGQMLEGRVMVAHNAQFDYDFLVQEFARVGSVLPVARRLCTLALNRRLGTPTDDLRLGTLAAFYGVTQLHGHDALDDTRVLAGVLRGSLAEAARLGVPLPLVACPPRRTSQYRPGAPKARCAYRNPGRLEVGGRLVQGMKVAVTGETRMPREELVARAVTVGLNVMSSVSQHTSVLVTNDRGSASAKATRAAAEGVPFLDEASFFQLLEAVRPGTAHPGGAECVRADAPVGAGAAASASSPLGLTGKASAVTATNSPLAGHRVLVVGGEHDEAAATRAHVAELGGAAAVNISGSVTDVVVLPGGAADRRMHRIGSLGLAVHNKGWLRTTRAEVGERRPVESVPVPVLAARVLQRGEVVDLPVTTDRTRWTVNASWAQQTTCVVDVVAFTLDDDEQVFCDEDFIFYGAPERPDGTVWLSADGPTEQAITFDLALLPGSVHKIVLAAAIDGAATFGDVGAVEITAAVGSTARPAIQATLDASTTERTLLLAEIYRRGPAWRLRAVGQGFDHDLDALARAYGVDIEG